MFYHLRTEMICWFFLGEQSAFQLVSVN